MRIPRITDLSTQGKLDTLGFANGFEARVNHGEALGVGTSQFLSEVGFGVNTTCLGEGGVEVEGVPGYGEGVVCGTGNARAGGTVEGDGAFETGFAYVAPWADDVGDYFDLEVCHVCWWRGEVSK